MSRRGGTGDGRSASEPAPRQRSLWEPDDVEPAPSTPTESPESVSAPPDRPSKLPTTGALATVAAGPRAVEARLLGAVEALLPLGSPDERMPSVCVVVPSLSLRTHVLCAAARHFDRPLLGFTCQTHHSLARDVLGRAGRDLATSNATISLFVRRFAQHEPAIAARLSHLRDGLGAAAGTVRDLIDAGLDPAHVETIEEVLAADGPAAASRVEIERAAALVRIAARTLVAHGEVGLSPPSALVREAAVALRTLGSSAAPVDHYLIHGYADATGATTDLLRALVDVCRATVFLDRPVDPAAPDQPDRGNRYSTRFVERLGVLEAAAAAVSPTAAASFRALGTDAESREVADRCRVLLGNGTAAERIAIVARDLAPYALPLRRHLHRLAIPHSGVGSHGPIDPFGRRSEAVLDLLRQRAGLRIDRWFELVPESALEAPRGDLKIALAAAGRTRLKDLVEIDVDRLCRGRDQLPLPVRVGIVSSDELDHPRSRAQRRYLGAADLRHEQQRARTVLQRIADAAAVDDWLERLTAVLSGEGIAVRDGERRRLLEAFERSAHGLPAELTLRHEEVALLFESALREATDRPLGGVGGGVQLLDVTEARGRSFDHLFLVGMNRGSFPRSIVADPLLPDPLREVLARSGHGVLPDLPIKRSGYDEERYLFAQLSTAAAEQITFSWLEADAEGRPAAPSPLVERLQWSGHLPDRPELVGEPYARDVSVPRAAAERAVHTALRAPRSELATAFETALADVDAEAPAAELAESRLAVLAELAPRPGEVAWRDLGPYFGTVGEAPPEDPRRARALFVTTLERLALCPWNAFLERLLAIAPYPDPFDVLPRVDPLRIGSLVHRLLERVVAEQLHASTTESEPDPDADPTAPALAERPAVTLEWPAAERIERWLTAEAKRLVDELGMPAPGYARALTTACRPFVDVVGRLVRADPPRVLGAEVFGEVSVPLPYGGTTALHFRADRVDATADGLRFVDYKTGAPFSDAVRAATRRTHFEQRVARGESLQAVAYAHSQGGADEGAYLFLRPDTPADDDREVVATAADGALEASFRAAAGRGIEIWQRGLLVPRLSEAAINRQPPICERCDVREACLQGDSGARARLREWFQGAVDRPAAERTERAALLLSLWYSGDPPEVASGTESETEPR